MKQYSLTDTFTTAKEVKEREKKEKKAGKKTGGREETILLEKIAGELEEINHNLSLIVKVLSVLTDELVRISQSQPKTAQSQRHGGYGGRERQGGRRTAYDILKEQKILFASDVKSRELAEKIFASLERHEDVVVIRGERDAVAVYKPVLEDFARTLEKIPADRIEEKLRGLYKKLFMFLRDEKKLLLNPRTKKYELYDVGNA